MNTSQYDYVGKATIQSLSTYYPPISSTNKTDHHDMTEILLKVALNIITLTLFNNQYS
jgi:hypothetical protein